MVSTTHKILNSKEDLVLSDRSTKHEFPQRKDYGRLIFQSYKMTYAVSMQTSIRTVRNAKEKNFFISLCFVPQKPFLL